MCMKEDILVTIISRERIEIIIFLRDGGILCDLSHC